MGDGALVFGEGEAVVMVWPVAFGLVLFSLSSGGGLAPPRVLAPVLAIRCAAIRSIWGVGPVLLAHCWSILELSSTGAVCRLPGWCGRCLSVCLSVGLSIDSLPWLDMVYVVTVEMGGLCQVSVGFCRLTTVGLFWSVGLLSSSTVGLLSDVRF